MTAPPSSGQGYYKAFTPQHEHVPIPDATIHAEHPGQVKHSPTRSRTQAMLMHLAKALLCLLLLATFTPFFASQSVFKLSHRLRGHLLYHSSKYPVLDLSTAPLEEVHYGLENGYFNSQDLVQAYLRRIEEVNDEIRAVIETNPHAMSEAKLLDDARSHGRTRGSLHGIPILLKDNIATARLDQTYMNTTAGSYALLGSFPAGDSTVAAKLKEAGAIILGKANLSQWSGHRSHNGTQGWSSRGGQCTGVYVEKQDPSGSSSGSATASALGLALASIGTDTTGSILDPAQRGNLCAIKPTVGLVSRHLVIPISETHDTLGPMARDCHTAAAILEVIAGHDLVNDQATADIPFTEVPRYAGACRPQGLQDARPGVPNAFVVARNISRPVWQAFNNSIEVIRKKGGKIQLETEFAALTEYLDIIDDEMKVIDVDFTRNLEQYYSKLYSNPNNITNLQDMVRHAKTDAREMYPDRDILSWEAALSYNFTEDSLEYKRALSKIRWIGRDGTLTGVLDKYDLDAIILPTDISYRLAAPGGLPVVTVPMGFYPEDTPVVWNERHTLKTRAPNIPFGLSFVGEWMSVYSASENPMPLRQMSGRRFSEEKLIAYACAFESATQIRNNGPKPYIMPKTNLKDVIKSHKSCHDKQ